LFVCLIKLVRQTNSSWFDEQFDPLNKHKMQLV